MSFHTPLTTILPKRTNANLFHFTTICINSNYLIILFLTTTTMVTTIFYLSYLKHTFVFSPSGSILISYQFASIPLWTCIKTRFFPSFYVFRCFFIIWEKSFKFFCVLFCFSSSMSRFLHSCLVWNINNFYLLLNGMKLLF